MRSRFLVVFLGLAVFAVSITVASNTTTGFNFPFLENSPVENSVSISLEPQVDLPTNLESSEPTVSAGSLTLQAKPIPDEILFDMFLVKVVSLHNAARKAKARGSSGSIWSEYLIRNGFTEQEVSVINKVAGEHAASIAPIHSKALRTIRAAREALKDGREIPPPPAELRRIQEERHTVSIDSREKLRHSSGL